MKANITFLLTGLLGGVVCVAPGQWLSIFTLTWGVGPAFFLALVMGVIITGARWHLQTNFLRYIAGLVVCFITYLFALMLFFAVSGFSPDWFGLDHPLILTSSVWMSSSVFLQLQHSPQVA